MSDVITLPDGTEVEVPPEETQLDLGFGIYYVHLHDARNRSIERWRDKATWAAVRDVMAREYEQIENAFWQVYRSRFVDDAGGASLKILGNIVGEPQNGKDDPSYRVRIKARERINGSFGKAQDILDVLALLEPTNSFVYTNDGDAAFTVALVNPPSGFATGTELASLIGETSAAGIGGLVVMPASASPDGFILGDVGGTLETTVLGDIGGVLVTSLADVRSIAA